MTFAYQHRAPGDAALVGVVYDDATARGPRLRGARPGRRGRRSSTPGARSPCATASGVRPRRSSSRRRARWWATTTGPSRPATSTSSWPRPGRRGREQRPAPAPVRAGLVLGGAGRGAGRGPGLQCVPAVVGPLTGRSGPPPSTAISSARAVTAISVARLLGLHGRGRPPGRPGPGAGRAERSADRAVPGEPLRAEHPPAPAGLRAHGRGVGGAVCWPPSAVSVAWACSSGAAGARWRSAVSCRGPGPGRPGPGRTGAADTGFGGPGASRPRWHRPMTGASSKTSGPSCSFPRGPRPRARGRRPVRRGPRRPPRRVHRPGGRGPAGAGRRATAGCAAQRPLDETGGRRGGTGDDPCIRSRQDVRRAEPRRRVLSRRRGGWRSGASSGPWSTHVEHPAAGRVGHGVGDADAAPQQTARTLAQAETLESDGNAVDAVKLYESVLRQDPTQEQALAEVGWLEYEAGAAGARRPTSSAVGEQRGAAGRTGGPRRPSPPTCTWGRCSWPRAMPPAPSPSTGSSWPTIRRGPRSTAAVPFIIKAFSEAHLTPPLSPWVTTRPADLRVLTTPSGRATVVGTTARLRPRTGGGPFVEGVEVVDPFVRPWAMPGDGDPGRPRTWSRVSPSFPGLEEGARWRPARSRNAGAGGWPAAGRGGPAVEARPTVEGGPGEQAQGLEGPDVAGGGAGQAGQLVHCQPGTGDWRPPSRSLWPRLIVT